MKYQTIRMGDGDTQKLKLATEQVVGVNSSILGIFTDDDVEAKTYKREIIRDSNPQFANLEIPDDAVIVNADHSTVDYLVEV